MHLSFRGKTCNLTIATILSSIYAGILLISGITIFGIFLFSATFSPIKIKNMEDGAVHVSEDRVLRFEREVCFDVPVFNGVAYRRISGDGTYSLGQSRLIIGNEAGCGVYTFVYDLPDDIKPGYYTYDLYIEAQIIPIFKTYYKSPEMDFIVLNEDGDLPDRKETGEFDVNNATRDRPEERIYRDTGNY